VRRSFAAAGFVSGVAKLDGLALAPFAYVMPALSKTAEHAAFYSETFRPAGTAKVDVGAMTFGQRDGAPFFHAHALWVEGSGRRNGGHILPDETVVAEAITLQAVGLDGAAFVAEPDTETNFKLFGPKPAELLEATRNGRFFALRVKPNVDFCGALEAFCSEQGIREAVIHGGVGSTIGARFDGGPPVDNFATEVAITDGRIADGGDGLKAAVDVALVDYRGGLASGRLLRGDNPVLMTFELLLEAF
jgi:predicted DNA-binding protein with PD1-like motif